MQHLLLHCLMLLAAIQYFLLNCMMTISIPYIIIISGLGRCQASMMSL